MNEQIQTLMSEEFSKDYEFYKDYDDIIIHKKTKEIFKVNFTGGFTQLIPVSNLEAMEKIEAGFKAFVEQLKKEGF